MRVLPDARLVTARTALELRLLPARLTGEIERFVERCWHPPAPSRAAS